MNAEVFPHRYVIGIDLGTTNSALAFVDLEEGDRAIRFFEVPQLTAPGETDALPVLPSFLYLPGPYDLPEGSTALPWAPERDYAVGALAREQGAKVPGRLVASAKSWLSHAAVDRRAPILPWGAGDEVDRVSPVEASTRYLRHLREAWNSEMATSEEARFEEQLVVVTVPASFDEVARELTVQATQQAGFPRIVLLEEPLAAFYAWLSEHGEAGPGAMQDGQLVLVCDIGGGTTDFSIIGVRQGEAELLFNRLAVGDHLLLGGDNMDLALGRHVEAKMLGRPGALDAQRWPQLVYEARQAKERLLSTVDPDAAASITLVGASGNLIGGTLTSELTHDEIEALILDGFFPELNFEEAQVERPRGGLTELGLPYVKDPAVTRHLAAFWRRYRPYLESETGRAAPYPDYLLFNGGALSPAPLRARLTGIVQSWFADDAEEGWRPEELPNPRPDLAVALGAAYYGLVRLGEGVRVGSGSPRAYYVAVDAAVDVPDDLEGEPRAAVCLVPRGTEEGFETTLDALDFTALTNQPVHFQLLTSSTRLGDSLGELVALGEGEVTTLPPIRTVLRYGKGSAQQLPVHLGVRLTEVGTLELWCHAQQTDHRWQLAFDIRQGAELDDETHAVGATIEQASIETAQAAIRETFQGDISEAPPERLRRRLEEALDMKKSAWPTTLIRQLADTFLEVEEGRALTPGHEERWLNLLGFCLRPGYGDPVDEWRMKQVWTLDFEGLAYPRQSRNRSEWWIFWRRVAGGLSAGQQTSIYQQVRPYLTGAKKKNPSRMYPKRLSAGEDQEIWMALANFERLPAKAKIELGRALLGEITKGQNQSQRLWALSRLGSRHAMYGPLDRLIPPEEAAVWADMLMKKDPKPVDSLAHALVLLTRPTGDRARDVAQAMQQKVTAWLERHEKADYFLDLYRDPESARRQSEADWMFGEALPTGLVVSAA